MARKITRRARRDDRSEELMVCNKRRNTSVGSDRPDDGAGFHSTYFYVFSLIFFYPIVLLSFLNIFIIEKHAILKIKLGFQALKIEKIPANLDVFGKKQRDLVTIG